MAGEEGEARYFASEYLEEQYDRMAESYNGNRGDFDNSDQLEELGRLVGKSARVLDVGCGSGRPVAQYFAGRGCDVKGFDLSGEMIKLARENVPRAEFYRANLLEVGYPPEEYELVVSFYCIFHIVKKRQPWVFSEFYRTLKPDGYSYLTLACDKYTGEKEFQGTVKFGDTLLPYAHYTPEKYGAILRETGFDVRSLEELTIGGETMLWALVQKK